MRLIVEIHFLKMLKAILHQDRNNPKNSAKLNTPVSIWETVLTAFIVILGDPGPKTNKNADFERESQDFRKR